MKVIAIVIDNNNYYEPYKLNNAVNDATSMADVFYRLGYTVVSEYDCDNKKYEDLLRRLESDLPQYDALTSSSCHPKIFIKQFCYTLMSLHDHCLTDGILILR